MDGSYAPLEGICDLADAYDALVLVDDSHAVGFIGGHGRGTPELFGVADRVDIVTGTLGKALGGASGGYVSRPGRDDRPAAAACASVPVLELGRAGSGGRLAGGARPGGLVGGAAGSGCARTRSCSATLMAASGFDLLPGSHPIVPVMFAGRGRCPPRRGDRRADASEGVYVIAFSYPVVPKGRARIRVQLSAAHSEDDVRACVRAFEVARAATPAHLGERFG